MIFPSLPAFLDSSNWNNNQQQAHHPSIDPSGGGGGGDGGELQQAMSAATLPEGGGGGGPGGPGKPMSMADRARLARIPQPEPGLKCPRCESTNTKFCYFNNYSLSQPRHFCRACRRYWTRGGALRNVPVGGGYRRHAKRAKPKVSAAASSSAATAPTPATSTNCTTVASGAAVPGMLGSNGSILPPLHRIADFEALNLGPSFAGAARQFIDAADVAYSVGGSGGGGLGLEQWRPVQQHQMQGFPFLHGMEQMSAAPAMSAAMVMPGMFHLGLNGGASAGDDGTGAFHGMAAKQDGYPRGMYGDLTGYSATYSSTTGNLL